MDTSGGSLQVVFDAQPSLVERSLALRVCTPFDATLVRYLLVPPFRIGKAESCSGHQRR